MELREVTYLAVALRILMAVILGGLLGLERELKNRPAGMRTYMLVCSGACLMMLTNQYIFQVFGTGDPVRMGAQVVSGIDLTTTLGKRPLVILEQPAEGQHTPLRLERLARTLSQLAGSEKIISHTSERPKGGQVLRQIALLPDWRSLSIAAFALLVVLWVMPFVPGLLRWLILLALPCGVIWTAAEQVKLGLWFTASPLLAWWVILALVFLLHRTHEKGLFGRRRR